MPMVTALSGILIHDDALHTGLELKQQMKEACINADSFAEENLGCLQDKLFWFGIELNEE